jgi:hypothetical protein
MEEPTKERWLELCEAASHEHDPTKLLEMTEEINRLLEEKEQHLKRPPPNAA